MFFTRENEKEVTAFTTNKGFDSIEEFLRVKSITIESTSIMDPKYNSGALGRFAATLADLQLKGAYPFIKYTRTMINEKNIHCSFDLNHLSEQEKKSCIEVAYLFCSVSALFHLRERNGILSGTFSFSSTRFVNFINGSFLEVAVYTNLKRILNEYAKEIDYEILPNVKAVSANGNKREYDILFRLGKNVYVIEIKSGHFTYKQFASYKERGMELGLYPERQMVVIADRTQEQMDLTSYFEGCAIASYTTFEETVRNMITK